MGNIVETVEVRIQSANLNADNNIITPRIELAVRSKNASSGRDVNNGQNVLNTKVPLPA